MSIYAFELGRKKELCEAELRAVLGEPKERGFDAVLYDLGDEYDDNPQKLQDRLGGTIKIIKIVDKLRAANNLKPATEKLLTEKFSNASGKIPFSVSLLSFKNQREINIKELLNFSKKILKSLGLNSRFVNKNFQNTKPSTIYKARVIEKGIDLCIIKSHDQAYLGYSVAIQNIDAYSKRDFDKPARDARVGMLPPKLAQIMINLAGTPRDHANNAPKTIFDPFCGTGTVLMEAMLMGKTAIGSDLEPRMVEMTKKNCEWFEKEFKTTTKWHTFEKDAQLLEPSDMPEKPDAIVTESYLGKPVSSFPNKEQMSAAFRALTELHQTWLRRAYQILPPHGRLVLCLPAFKDRRRFEYFPKFEQLAKTAGFRIISEHLYDRDDQVIAREIKVLQRL